jgi:hypothetical protein
LLALLTNGLIKRDIKALAKYFTRPADESKRTSGGGKKPEGPVIVPPVVIPPANQKKPYILSTSTNSVRVMPNKKFSDKRDDFLTSCVLEIAYEGLDQDSFKFYDPFDFDLSDSNTHQFLSKNIAIKERKFNKVHFEVSDPDFFLEIQGFDPNLRFFARLNYEQKL